LLGNRAMRVLRRRNGYNVIVTAMGGSGHENRNGASGSEPSGVSDSSGDVDVLVVDDDGALRSTWAAILRGSGYRVAVAEDGDVALRVLGERAVGLVLLDLRMPRRNGLSVLEELRTPQLVVLVSAHALDDATRAEVDAKVVTFLEKPVPPGLLLDTVSATLGPGRGTDG
jgi:two-component system response regulator HydG